MTSRLEGHHGVLVSRAAHRGTTADRQRGTWTSHPDPTCRGSVRRCWSFGYSTAGPRGRRPPRSSASVVPPFIATWSRSARGPRRLAAVQPPSPGERDGGLSRVDPRVLREATRPHHRRGLRTHLSTDRVATRSQPSAPIPQRNGPEIPAGSPDPCAAKKNLAEHARRPGRFPRGRTEAPPGGRDRRRRPCILRRCGPFRLQGPSYAACGRSPRIFPCGRLRSRQQFNTMLGATGTRWPGG